MLEAEIRHEEAADQSHVYEVVRSAFGTLLEADLVDSLRESAEPQLSLVALVRDMIIGHIFFSPVTFESDHAPAAAQLSPLAVAPPYQRQGVGSALIRAGLDRCSSKGWSSVFVVGNPLYYGRFGFEMARPHGFSYGGRHDLFLQFMELRPNALSSVSGVVQLHSAFSELEAE